MVPGVEKVQIRLENGVGSCAVDVSVAQSFGKTEQLMGFNMNDEKKYVLRCVSDIGQESYFVATDIYTGSLSAAGRFSMQDAIYVYWKRLHFPEEWQIWSVKTEVKLDEQFTKHIELVSKINKLKKELHEAEAEYERYKIQ